LKTAHDHDASVVHVPVYFGWMNWRPRRWGEWNVGNWCEDVQSSWIKQDL
jgi:3D-(3,5/4)-trihydroxycyclohexane-1,2-dione acylhydrolase (decyclizing)